ncbi:hypothetical protein [Allonocardiopsis opalescens]|uniref:Uncharacterized protein n=1 Tax=Allonocardiopsis opalescens TaxID=1144618 RepID=A0A2T0PPM9_9ACTN|nr:hypothetical protein [Allonocardiopsis opalescens]PRX90853.1 hypothetical protein CLV72_11649 [Allonocardiopsis opalescens]
MYHLASSLNLSGLDREPSTTLVILAAVGATALIVGTIVLVFNLVFLLIDLADASKVRAQLRTTEKELAKVRAELVELRADRDGGVR